jgi:protein phosphatase
MLDPDPQATADRLVELALRGGGPDNITVIVADVVEDGGYGTTTVDPVVDGAAGDNRGQRSVDPRSAAGRAALADPPAAPPATAGATASTAPAPSRRHRPLRWVLAGVGLVVVLAAVGAGVWIWALGHWFVGVEGSGDGEHVAVFRGLPASVIGVDLYRVDHPTDLAVADLTPAARSRVQKGITADDPADAQRILAALRDQRLPVCPAVPDGTPAANASAPVSPTTTPTPADGQPAAPTALTTPPTTAPSTTTPSTTTPSTTTPSTTAGAMVPGVDCREGK